MNNSYEEFGLNNRMAKKEEKKPDLTINGFNLNDWLDQALTTKSRVRFGGFAGEYQTQVGSWADPVVIRPVNGQMVVVYNTTQSGSRLYIYSNSDWRYITLT